MSFKSPYFKNDKIATFLPSAKQTGKDVAIFVSIYPTVAKHETRAWLESECSGAEDEAIQGGASGLVKLVSYKCRYLLEMSSLLFSAQARLTSYNDTYATDLAIQNPQH